MNKYIVNTTLAVVFLVAANAKADIEFNTPAPGGTMERGVSQLFDWINANLGTEYADNNALWQAHGIDPYTNWIPSGDWEMLTTPTSGGVGFSYNLNVINEKTTTLGSSGTTLSADDRIMWNMTGSLPAGTGEVSFALDVFYKGAHQYTLSSDPSQNMGIGSTNPIHMLAFDITGLYNTAYETNYNSVILFGWEDLLDIFKTPDNTGWWFRDNDYQDVFYIVANIKPTSEVPEPATLAILGLGLAGLGIARARRRK